MSSKEYILDLGIGNGGEYLKRDDPEKTVRVGVERKWPFFSILKENAEYNKVLCCTADADLLSTNTDLPQKFLPFVDKSYNKIEAYFPHEELLYGLCGMDNGLLWHDLNRLLKDDGSVEIVVDVPFFSRTHSMNIKGKIVDIDYPEDKICDASKKNGFQVKLTRMESEETKLIGTMFSKSALEWNCEVFKITAEKV